MQTSGSLPIFANVPGMTAVKDSWVLRNLDGFKRVKGSRPQSATHKLARRRNESGTSTMRMRSPRKSDRNFRFTDAEGKQGEESDLKFTYDEMIEVEMDPYRVTPSPGMPNGYRVRPLTANDTNRYNPRSAMGRIKKIDAGDLAAEGLTSPIRRISSLANKIVERPEYMSVPVQNRGNLGATIVSATNRRPDLPYLEPALTNSDQDNIMKPVPKHRIPGSEYIENDILLADETHMVTSNEPKIAKNYLKEADRKEENDARADELMMYMDHTKLTCRFSAYFTEDRVWDTNAPIGTPVIETTLNRHLTFEYHVFDGTWTIYEKRAKNLGIVGGKFLKRGKIIKDDDPDNMCLTVFDMVPGNDVHILGKKIRVTGADEATHKFLEENYNLSLRDKEKLEIHPDEAREDLGAHYAFGFGGKTFPPRQDNTFPPTYEFYQRREQNMKTRRFLFNDARPLRFNCVEINDRADDGAIPWSVYEDWKAGGEKGPLMITNSIRLAVLTYYIPDYCLEITLGFWPNQVVKHQQEPLILKRSKIQKNWREDKKKEPTFYEPSDFICGEIVDIYGRYYLLVDADDGTRERYLDMGHDQKRIEVEIEKVVPVERPLPKAGDGFLDIGAPEQTLATVYGQSKKMQPDPNRERNRGRLLRCRAKLISKMPIDRTRAFSITFYMEDNTLSIFEEDVRNSGVVGGTYLKRGRYTNFLPREGGKPRYFTNRDIFLGNVISVNKVEFQITEVDGSSLRFCEANPDEFPMSDTFHILMRLLDHVLDNALNVRKICKNQDRERKGYFDKNTFVKLMDVLCLGGAVSSAQASQTLGPTPEDSTDIASIESERLAKLLNDQEILTIMRRFQDEESNKYHYDEMCDIFSHFYCVREKNGTTPIFGESVHSLQELKSSMRSSKVQWRRVFRKDINCVKGFMTADHLLDVFKKLGLCLSEIAIDELSHKFAIPDDKAIKVIQVLNRKLNKAQNISFDASIASISVSTVGSMSSQTSKASEGSCKRGIRKGPALNALPKGTVKGSNLDEMSVASVTVEGRRRQLQQTLPGVMRKTQPRHKAKDTVIKLDLGATVISCHALCDFVFISEWTFD